MSPLRMGRLPLFLEINPRFSSSKMLQSVRAECELLWLIILIYILIISKTDVTARVVSHFSSGGRESRLDDDDFHSSVHSPSPRNFPSTDLSSSLLQMLLQRSAKSIQFLALKGSAFVFICFTVVQLDQRLFLFEHVRAKQYITAQAEVS